MLTRMIAWIKYQGRIKYTGFSYVQYIECIINAQKHLTIQWGVCVCPRSDGWLEAWDIIMKQSSPVTSKEVCSGPLHCLAIHPGGQHLCLGQNFQYAPGPGHCPGHYLSGQWHETSNYDLHFKGLRNCFYQLWMSELGIKVIKLQTCSSHKRCDVFTQVRTMAACRWWMSLRACPPSPRRKSPPWTVCLTSRGSGRRVSSCWRERPSSGRGTRRTWSASPGWSGDLQVQTLDTHLKWTPQNPGHEEILWAGEAAHTARGGEQSETPDGRGQVF